MRDQIAKYTAKLHADCSVVLGAVGFAVLDDVLLTSGDPVLAQLAGDIASRSNCLGVVAARPALPFADFLVQRAKPEEDRIIPRDTETRTFLHDIPFLRRMEAGSDAALPVSRLLGNRKGVIVEGAGIVALGAMTIEQAYINYSSIFHATFVKYLQDLLHEGFRFPG
ncbi:MAG: aldolase, partial [Dissulfurispiraceae bacterium]